MPKGWWRVAGHWGERAAVVKTHLARQLESHCHEGLLPARELLELHPLSRLRTAPAWRLQRGVVMRGGVGGGRKGGWRE